MTVLESVPIAENDVLYYRYVFNQTAAVLRVNKIIKKPSKTSFICVSKLWAL